MILVLTHADHEQGTEPVLDWLLAYGASFLKISSRDLVETPRNWVIDVNRGDILIDGLSLRDHVHVVWYRRFFDPFDAQALQRLGPHAPQVAGDIRNETNHLAQFLFEVLQDKVWLPDYAALQRTKNKLSVLQLAQRCGLPTPRSLVLTTKAQLRAFWAECGGRLITKPVDFCGYYLEAGDAYTAFTTRVTEAMMAELPDTFFPTLFQQQVAAEYELRVFYLDGTCYATAILSTQAASPDQPYADVKLVYSSPQTHVVPYQLPPAVALRVAHFMRTARLRTGSLDLMRTADGEYVFIEVNPVGQFLSPSQRCHHHLEQHLARWLADQDHDQALPAPAVAVGGPGYLA
jgi:hypothetical protein